MNKKGILGIEYVKPILVSLLILAVLVVVIFLITTSLTTTVESSESARSEKIVNQTLTTVTESGESLTQATYRQCAITSSTVVIINSTDNAVIPSTNYTVNSGCRISFSGTEATFYNNTNWKFSGTITFKSPESSQILGNITVGSTNFFKQIPTFMTLLGVVVLILIIGIVIATVMRFQGREGGGTMVSSRGSGVSDQL